MTDLTLALLWTGVLAAGLALTLLASARGLPASHARDLLHIGAGVWVLGWPWWDGLLAPLTLVAGAALMLGAVPLAAPHLRVAARFRGAVARGDERFAGLIVYTLSFAVMTWAGLTGDPFPAAAALLALAVGDGIGGLIGRHWGRRLHQVPWGKPKSVEGSIAVAVFAAVGCAAAAAWFDAGIAARHVVALGIVGAGAEALAPRGADNALVPVAVWAAAELLV